MHCLIIRREDKAGDFRQDHTDANGHEDLVFRQDGVYFNQRIQEIFLEKHSQEKERGHGHQKREVGVQVQVMGKDKGDVHGHHHELAMGQIDDPHDSHDEGHAYSDQAVNATNKNPCHQSLKEDIHLAFLSSIVGRFLSFRNPHHPLSRNSGQPGKSSKRRREKRIPRPGPKKGPGRIRKGWARVNSPRFSTSPPDKRISSWQVWPAKPAPDSLLSIVPHRSRLYSGSSFCPT